MKILLLLSLLAGAANAVHADSQLKIYDWKNVPKESILSGEVIELEGRSALKLENPDATPRTIPVLKIENPGIAGTQYSLAGQVRYDDVQGDGYLEMWNCFPPAKAGNAESRYFSRTMGVSGPMGKLAGTSGWRAFRLPFNRSGTSSTPDRLEFNVFLPGKGTVYIGNIDLSETKSTAWWSPRTGGLLGGISGAVIGCLGGLIAWLVSKSRARTFVMSLAWTLIALGAVLTVTAILALIVQQPQSVWGSLLLSGIIILIVIPLQLRSMRRQYRDLEMRRMHAQDVLGT